MRLPIALLAVVLTAGCASATSVVGHAAPLASLSQASNADCQASAQSDAALHLAVFVPPTGAHQLQGRPACANALVSDPGMNGRTTSRKTSWWELTSWKATDDVVSAVAPAGATAGDSWGTGGTSTETWTRSFHWPVGGHVLISRQPLITGMRLGDKVVLRVDGETIWVPQRPKDSLIPPGVAFIVMTFKRPVLGPDPGTLKPYDPITVTDPAQIDTVVNLVDAASVDPYRVIRVHTPAVASSTSSSDRRRTASSRTLLRPSTGAMTSTCRSASHKPQ